MLKKIKFKLRSNSKILKFSKRYLAKYYSFNALDPRRLKSGDVDWDLPLVDFLNSVNDFTEFGAASFLDALSLGSSEVIDSSRVDASTRGIALPLIWLMSHYISAPASSHGLGLAYITQDSGRSLDQLDLVTRNMPTSVKLAVFSCNDGTTNNQSYQCGGLQSSFESQDLTLFNHDHSSDRNCAFVIDATRFDKNYEKAIEVILNDQRVISYVGILVNKGDPLPTLDIVKNWDIQQIHKIASNQDLYLCTNPRWEQDLGSIHDLRFRDGSTSTIDDFQCKGQEDIPLVDACSLSVCDQISPPIVEYISDSKIQINAMSEDGHTRAKSGNTKAFFTTSPALYVATDVCVSGTSVVWKDQKAFKEADLSHDVNRVMGSKVLVSKPTHTLKGEYFLASTNNPHHSHLIFETLQHLHLVSDYCPDAKLLLSDALTTSQRDYFSSFGFTDERCQYRSPSQTYQIDKLYFLGPSEPTFNRRSIKFMQGIGSKVSSMEGQLHDRIYLSRRDARIYRNLVNELEIEEIFKSFGFMVVLPSELTAAQKIQLFSKAKYIAGALGAAFTYAPFANNPQLIILSSNMYFPEMFPQMAALQLAKINYIRGIGLKHYSDIWGYEHCSFYLQPNLVRNSLLDIFPI